MSKNLDLLRSIALDLTPKQPKDDFGIYTVSGQYISFDNPKQNKYLVTDIASGLARQNRYIGQMKFEWYSIAQHSVLCALIDGKISTLFHDSPEAYLHDINKPLKNYIENHTMVYKELEIVFTDQIYSQLMIPREEYKEVDNLMFIIEEQMIRQNNVAPMRKLMSAVCPDLLEKYGLSWNPGTAERIFCDLYFKLSKGIQVGGL